MVYLEGLVLSLNNFSFCLTKQCANLSKHSWTFFKFNHILYINNLYSRIFYEIIKDTNSCKQPKFVLFPNDRKPLYLLYDINSGTFCTLLHKFWELSCGYLWYRALALLWIWRSLFVTLHGKWWSLPLCFDPDTKHSYFSA